MNINLKKICIFITLIIYAKFSAQEKIHLTAPENWIEFQRDEVMNSIYNKYSFSEKILKEITENGKGSIQLLGYYTNDKKGLYRPNIQVILRPGIKTDIHVFKTEIEKSINGFSRIIKDFKIIEPMTIIKINGKDAISVKFTGYHLNAENKKSNFETLLIAIPVGEYFYQITFNQSPEDDFDKDFTSVLNSIKFEE